MRKAFIGAAALLVLFTTFTYSQSMDGSIVVVTTYDLRNAGDEWVPGELDSLTREYQKAITDGNEYILDYMTLRHFWGNDNADFVVMYKVAKWEDIPKANERMNQLFEEKWSTKESQDAFNKAYNKYFSGRHSDEIYREIK